MRAMLLFACLALPSFAAAQPTLTVLSSNATSQLIHELAPDFKQACRCELHVKFDNSAAIKTRIEGGEAFDVAVLTSTTISDLAMAGRLAAATRQDIARAGVGMAIHPLATKPDISSLDTLKGALITARSITYVEQGATANVLRAIFAKLGLTEAMNAKTVYSQSAAHAVADKKAELGFTQISEILHVPGATFAAPLPPEVQVYTTFAAAAKPNAPPPAARFIAMLAAMDAATVRKVGMEQIPADRLPIAVKAGVSGQVLDAMAEGRRPSNMTTEETILYDFCLELHHDKAVSDATYARALASFGEQGVVDTIGITGYYTMLAMTLNVARTPAGESGSPSLRPQQ